MTQQKFKANKARWMDNPLNAKEIDKYTLEEYMVGGLNE